ncbi:MAG: hypothetical protein ABW123_19325 [Cystobacter sp.]
MLPHNGVSFYGGKSIPLKLPSESAHTESGPPPTYRASVARRKQFPHSSSATALLCCALEMGRSELWEGTPLEAEAESEKAEGVIYRTILGLPAGSSLDDAGFSPLAGLIGTARRLAFECYVHVSRPMPETLVDIFGEGIVEALGALNVPIEEGSEFWLDANQRRLRLVSFDASKPDEEPVPKEMRYVMERPNDSIMNPETGENHENPKRLNETSTTGKYANTGVSLVIIDTQWKPSQ